MNLVALTLAYPQLSESFVSRELDAFAALGHRVTVLTCHTPSPILTPPTTLPVAVWTDAACRAATPDVLYASLGLKAHQRAVQLAWDTNTPYLLRVWQGFDAFTAPSPDFYATASAHRLCLGVIVEDEWMRRYAIERMQVRAETLHVVPNSIDVERFTPRDGDRPAGPVRILAICRLVKKKGMIHLVRAFNALRTAYGDAIELLIVGYGDEREHLRSVAGPGVTLADPVPESALPALYQSADLFCAPCVQCRNGDADGIPTTVLEAMACGLSVVASDLLSAREYVGEERGGLCVKPGDEGHLASALAALIDQPQVRAEWGGRARAFAEQQLDLRQNIRRIEAVMLAGNEHRWRAGLEGIAAARRRRPAERVALYDQLTTDALAFWQLSGEVLDVGAGDGRMRGLLNGAVTRYAAVDVAPFAGPEVPQWYTQAAAEALPFVAASFDAVLSYSVLQHVAKPAVALAEAARVLRPGGRLALLVIVNDRNAIFMHWWKPDEVLALVEAAGFRIPAYQLYGNGRVLCVTAQKPGR